MDVRTDIMATIAQAQKVPKAVRPLGKILSWPHMVHMRGLVDPAITRTLSAAAAIAPQRAQPQAPPTPVAA